MVTQASSRIYRFQTNHGLPSSSSSSEHAQAHPLVQQSSAIQLYTLRGLALSEVEEWTQFCASVFASKRPYPPPASYFARHFYNDPDRDASLIRVAMEHDHHGVDNNIVASCRVFRRTISAGPSAGVVFAGGIGEVCTSHLHRRRGLAQELLQDAVAEMKSIQECTVSLLHAAPAFFTVYEKAGYHRSVSRWYKVTVDVPTFLQREGDSNAVRLASFPTDTEEMMRIHQFYSEHRFAGCIIRSEDYWNQYISKELQGSLFVLEADGNSAESTSPIQGWLSLRNRGQNQYQVREFGCRSVDAVPSVFLQLLRHNLGNTTADQELQSIQLTIPAVVCDEAGLSEADWLTEALEHNDNGWMYRDLSDESGVPPAFVQSGIRHLIWPSDSF